MKRNELDDFLAEKEAAGVGITPWFALIARSFLPEWWDNLGDLHRFKDHEKIQKFS